jgi:hypothetical protein
MDTGGVNPPPFRTAESEDNDVAGKRKPGSNAARSVAPAKPRKSAGRRVR